jgi:hypothetical protein
MYIYIYIYDICFIDVMYAVLRISLYACLYRKSIDEVLDRGSNTNNSQELSRNRASKSKMGYEIWGEEVSIAVCVYICIYIYIYLYSS